MQYPNLKGSQELAGLYLFISYQFNSKYVRSISSVENSEFDSALVMDAIHPFQ